MPEGDEKEKGIDNLLNEVTIETVHVFKEIWISRNSNTPDTTQSKRYFLKYIAIKLSKAQEENPKHIRRVKLHIKKNQLY